MAAARTLALQNADAVFLMGERFNWIFHFGQAPRYDKDMQVIQLSYGDNLHNPPPGKVVSPPAEQQLQGAAAGACGRCASTVK